MPLTNKQPSQYKYPLCAEQQNTNIVFHVPDLRGWVLLNHGDIIQPGDLIESSLGENKFTFAYGLIDGMVYSRVKVYRNPKLRKSVSDLLQPLRRVGKLMVEIPSGYILPVDWVKIGFNTKLKFGDVIERNNRLHFVSDCVNELPIRDWGQHLRSSITAIWRKPSKLDRNVVKVVEPATSYVDFDKLHPSITEIVANGIRYKKISKWQTVIN